jgi:alkanesulfonate monooxygenase SsuD/methylene tetrahydromethanopterin reductase-like flavin-dependent oxidoreductase (luciferase family)
MATCIVGETRADVVAGARAVLAAWGADDQDPEAVLAERAERWVAGTQDEVVARLRELEVAGVERVYLQHLAPADTAMVEPLGEIARAVG